MYWRFQRAVQSINSGSKSSTYAAVGTNTPRTVHHVRTVRTAASAYSILSGVPPADAVVETPPPFAAEMGRPFPARRSASSAYSIAASFVPADPPCPGVQAITNAAPGAIRSSRTAYAIASTFVPADPPCPGQQLLPDSAPSARRNANTTYWVNTSFTTPEVAESMPPGQQALTDRVYRPYYNAEQWRWHYRLATLSVDDPTEGKPVMPSTAPGARRAGSTAYWREPLLPDFLVDAPTPGKPQISDISRPYLRTANVAYWRHNQLPIAELGDPTFPWQRAITDRAPGRQRAANHVYWIWEYYNQPFDVNPPEGLLARLPDRAPGARRTAVSAYDVAMKAQIADAPQATEDVLYRRVAYDDVLYRRTYESDDGV